MEGRPTTSLLAVQRHSGHRRAAQRPAILLSRTGHQCCRAILLEVPAFGPGRAASVQEPDDGSSELIELGRTLFQKTFSPAEGLGPLFNGRSCIECHVSPVSGGTAPEGVGFVLRVGRRAPGGRFDPLIGRGGPIARAHTVADAGLPCRAVSGIPVAANITSVRSASALFGLGLVDAVPDAAISALAAGGTAGRMNLVRGADGQERVGRFGWKADTAALDQFVADAFRNELGITSPLAPVDLVAPAPGCGTGAGLDDDGTAVRAVAAYIRSLPPLPPGELSSQAGAAVFTEIGCSACHVPALPGPDGQSVMLYSDLLLHDMGASLDDGVVQGGAGGADWRTAPLWGVGHRSRLLHDGRATSLAAAVLAHDGEGAEAALAFRNLPSLQHYQLLAFLESL